MPGMSSAERQPRVLIVSGGYVSVKDRSPLEVLRKQVLAFRAGDAPWYDIHMKVLNAEHLLAARAELAVVRLRRPARASRVRRFFADERLFDPPELADVLLTTLLRAEGVATQSISCSELLSDTQRREQLLEEADCVFVSATLLRDLSELQPVVAAADRPHNRIVVGGALASLVHADWPELSAVDVLAVGYGERLVGPLVEWMRSGFRDLPVPSGGRMEQRGRTAVLFSGVPEGRSLDHLPRPDWSLAEQVHGRRFPLVHYEAARGCPYRCAFCSYPYLFDDCTYRTRSAERIAADWVAYAQRGVQFVSCLDSVFTMPKRRLVELCERLVDAGAPVRWLCYARGDDLNDIEVCRLMRRAGCIQVQIGVESGNQTVLDNMRKRTTVAANAEGLANCHRAGIATFISVILGFPGETAATVGDTWAFIRETAPDFCYATPFTVRVPYLPVLQPESRARFGLRTYGSRSSSSPYWQHATMNAGDIGHWWRWLHRRMMQEGASLDASLFYNGMLEYDRARDRADLLEFQRDAIRGHPALRSVFSFLRTWSDRRLRRDLARAFPPPQDRH